ncbi:LytTR family DNA-binding domain-containing protein [Cohnella herbarum]|uniref:LytTR family transcriptional regulator n=1 Tax=Cohnella herbarum TaxID=2728023 RepID=A0A7Z2VMQ4_9BACL|nr:LytTR family DNA-binding domain-containing protein [Cohnella herbarum]QJD85933.1 LytTR family transcriptional regulator [Cohnella herbarum]
MNWDGTFSLTEKADGSAGFISINADEILYFCVDQSQSQIKAHTLEQEYYAGWDTLDRLMQALQTTAPQFYRTDRIFLVNLTKVRKIDTEWCKAYFIDAPDYKSKYCYIARLKLGEVKRRISQLSS